MGITVSSSLPSSWQSLSFRDWYFFSFFLEILHGGRPGHLSGELVQIFITLAVKKFCLASHTNLFHLNFIQRGKALKEFQGGAWTSQLKPLSPPLTPKRDWESPTRTCRTRLCAPRKRPNNSPARFRVSGREACNLDIWGSPIVATSMNLCQVQLELN